MADFEGYSTPITGPSSDVFPIAPNDGADLVKVTRAIRANGAGDVVAVMLSGNERTLKFGAGETRAVRVVRVKATGTTASDLEGIV